jgi:hypothetical protein
MALAVGTPLRDRRPQAYRILVEDLGWLWAATADSIGHLVPPEGDRARCGHVLPRHRRAEISPTPATTCLRCRASVGLP